MKAPSFLTSATLTLGLLLAHVAWHAPAFGQAENQPENRWGHLPQVPDAPIEVPGFFWKGETLVKLDKPILKPDGTFDATFNPAAFVAKQNGVEKVFMVVRAEINLPNAEWKRKSLPYLFVSDDGIHFNPVTGKPMFEAEEWFNKAGGIEDCRYAAMLLQPYVDPVDGKSFDGVIFYTGLEVKDGVVTPRVGAAFFNHDDLSYFRKAKNPVFKDEDVLKNPSIPGSAWNKSPAMIQYRDPLDRNVIHNVLYISEGNKDHGGIMAFDSKRPFDWKWGMQRPVIMSQANHYTQNLVEAAFMPVIAPLTPELAKETGESHGIYLALHGDSNSKGYQVGHVIFSLLTPLEQPIYNSKGVFLTPDQSWEIVGQVGKVVFASGMVTFKGMVYVYYGAADSYVGVAMAKAAEQVPYRYVLTRIRAMRKAKELLLASQCIRILEGQ